MNPASYATPRDRWEAQVRHAVEELGRADPVLVDMVGLRALGRRVWCWTTLTAEELDAVWGAARAVDLVCG